jgi:putative molybdopterin-guanine dinucleotide biosynthesis protein A
MILNITNVEYLGDYSLLCLFNNGKKKRVDLTPLLSYPAFEELKDKSKFIQFGLDGTIFWANGADVSPEYLFDHGIDEA